MTGTAFKEKPATVPAVGWRDGSGAWVVVFGDSLMPQPDTESESVLLGTAATVTLTAPTDARMPFHLGYVPAGLRPTQSVLQDEENEVIGFGGQPRWVYRMPPLGSEINLPLYIQVLLRSDYVDQYEVGRPFADCADPATWMSPVG